MSPGRRRVVVPDGAGARTRRAPTTTATWIDDDDSPATRPALAPPARRGATHCRRTFDASSYTWNDATWTGRQPRRIGDLRAHIGTFTPEGTFDGAREARPPARDRRRPRRGDAGQRVQRRQQLGVRRRRLVRGPRGTAARRAYRQRFVDGCHAAGIGVIQDVVYNHLGPSGNYLPRFGPYLKDGGQHLGRLGQPRRSGVVGGAPLHPRQRADVAPGTTSTAFGSTPCTP